MNTSLRQSRYVVNGCVLSVYALITPLGPFLSSIRFRIPRQVRLNCVRIGWVKDFLPVAKIIKKCLEGAKCVLTCIRFCEFVPGSINSHAQCLTFLFWLTLGFSARTWSFELFCGKITKGREKPLTLSKFDWHVRFSLCLSCHKGIGKMW